MSQLHQLHPDHTTSAGTAASGIRRVQDARERIQRAIEQLDRPAAPADLLTQHQAAMDADDVTEAVRLQNRIEDAVQENQDRDRRELELAKLTFATEAVAATVNGLLAVADAINGQPVSGRRFSLTEKLTGHLHQLAYGEQTTRFGVTVTRQGPGRWLVDKPVDRRRAVTMDLTEAVDALMDAKDRTERVDVPPPARFGMGARS